MTEDDWRLVIVACGAVFAGLCFWYVKLKTEGKVILAKIVGIGCAIVILALLADAFYVLATGK